MNPECKVKIQRYFENCHDLDQSHPHEPSDITELISAFIWDEVHRGRIVIIFKSRKLSVSAL